MSSRAKRFGRSQFIIGSSEVVQASPENAVRSGGRESQAAARTGERAAGYGNRKKGGGVLCEGVAVKYVWIQDHRDRYDVARMCRQLEISRTGYCQWRKRKPSETGGFSPGCSCRVDLPEQQAHIWPWLPRTGKSGASSQQLNRQGLRPVYKRPFRITTDSDHDKSAIRWAWVRTSPVWKPQSDGFIWHA